MTKSNKSQAARVSYRKTASRRTQDLTKSDTMQTPSRKEEEKEGEEKRTRERERQKKSPSKSCKARTKPIKTMAAQ